MAALFVLHAWIRDRIAPATGFCRDVLRQPVIDHLLPLVVVT
jgi:hypothetical protein